jgi:putative transposase
LVKRHQSDLGVGSLCDALGLPRSTFYRSGQPSVLPKARMSFRRLPDSVEKNVLTVLNNKRFCDLAPAEVFAILLDEGEYLCSERTMYRILKRNGDTLCRRQHPPRSYQRPELLATAPNQVWTWDITKLKGPAKWTYYYLYTILDIFSRYIVGWLLALKESADLANDLIAESCLKQEIVPGTLLLHSDCAATMKSRAVGHMLADLGITKSLSRPHVSNDNPFVESSYKTMKYRPEFPDRFESYQAAEGFCNPFFDWYNNRHRHSGIGMLAPADVHYGQAENILLFRQETLLKAFKKYPDRFVKGIPIINYIPKEVWINKPITQKTEKTPSLIKNAILSQTY